MKIVFIGTPEFGAIILEKLIKSEYRPVLVVTSPDKKVGRKQILTASPVKIIAQKYNILFEQPNEIRNLKLKIKNLQPDLAVVAAYSHIIPKEILEIPRYGCLNVHPSLLPYWRGPSPIQFTILKDDKETGVTIMKMTEKVDAGPIISSIKYQITDLKIAYPELHNKLAKLGAELLIETIPGWLKGEIKPKLQNELKASYSKILKKEDGRIDWQKPAAILEREVRAFYPWPGSWTVWPKQDKLITIKILKARIFQPANEIKSLVGKVTILPENNIGIKCKENFLLIERLQTAGKKEMAAQDFLRGNLDFTSALLQ